MPIRSLRHGPPLRGALSALTGVLFVLLTATGCGTPTRLDAVPVASQAKASVVGMPEVRYWGDAKANEFLPDAPNPPDGVSGHPRSVSPGHEQRRGGRQEVRGNACGRRHHGAGVRLSAQLQPEGGNAAGGVTRQRHLYVIRNARLDPDWAQVDRQTVSIANRAIASLIQTQGVGDLYRIHIAAQRDGIDFDHAYIPASLKTPLREPFDQTYMRALFKLGYDLAVNGYPWAKTRPGYAAPQVDPPLPSAAAGVARAATARRAAAGTGF